MEPEAEDIVDEAWVALHGLHPLPDRDAVESLTRSHDPHTATAGWCLLLAAARRDPDAFGDLIPEALDAADDDPERYAATAFRAALVYLALEDPTGADHVLTSALDDSQTPDSLRGALLCTAAICAQRLGLPLSESLALLDSAEDLCGAPPNCWHTEFCTANVAAHRISVLTEAGEWGAARELFEHTDFAPLSKERVARIAADLGEPLL